MLSQIRHDISGIIDPFARFFLRLGLSPNQITITGLIIGLATSYLIATGYYLYGGILVIVCGLFDTLDGAVARLSNRITPYGGILDSTTDRIVDASLLIGVGISGAAEWLLITIAITASLIVSYVRARSEATGIIKKLDTGIAERAERMIILAAGLIAGFIRESIILIILH